MPRQTIDELAIEQFVDMADPDSQGVSAYYDDPGGFVTDCILWKPGQGPAPYQVNNMAALVEHGRLAVRGPRGLGKTSTNAWFVLWFALTRDANRDDWKVICTAAVYRQLKDYLWSEVDRKWRPRLNWAKIGRRPFTTLEMMREELRLSFGSATLAASTDPAKIEGAHADQILYIFDEAKSIPDEIFDSAEGAFSGAGEETEQDAYVVASSTPGPPQGRFYDIHQRADGLHDWQTVHVTLDEVLAAKRMGRKWAKDREEQFGRDSSWYQNHVLGEFAAEAADGVIRQVTLEEAHERWLELDLPAKVHTGEFKIPQLPQLGPLHAVGVDLAAGGQDRSAYALRYGNTIGCLMLRPQQADTMVPTGEVKSLLESAEHHPVGIIDSTGIGIPVFNRLREQKCNAKAFVASEASSQIARGTGQGFVDARAAAWWNLREALEPESGMELAIPPDDQLTADLLAPRWTQESNGRIRVESKKDIKKRLRRSTDMGDAVVQVLWHGAVGKASAPIFTRKTSRWAPLRERAMSGHGVL